MRSDGVTLKGFLVILAVIMITSGVLFLYAHVILEAHLEDTDAKRMRQIFVAIALYEGSNNELPPPSLAAIRDDVGDDQAFLAQNDPYTSGSLFPLDPALPDLPLRSPIRISFTYLPDWLESGRYSTKSWIGDVSNVKLGLLSSYWYGKIDTVHPDGRDCNGGVLRVNMDGSVYRLPHRKDQNQLTVDDLFIHRAGQ